MAAAGHFFRGDQGGYPLLQGLPGWWQADPDLGAPARKQKVSRFGFNLHVT